MRIHEDKGKKENISEIMRYFMILGKRARGDGGRE